MTTRKVRGNPKLAILVMGAIAVMAQGGIARADDEPAPAVNKLERVEVTGSSIKRTIEGETSLPVTVIQSDELAKSGVTTVEQLLTQLPSMQNAGSGAINTSGNVGLSTGGQSTVSLRGLGPNYTLILVNGMRLANFAYAPGSGDAGSIPLAAVDRIEVLRDGASAIYGTDAIGGVVNFITKRDYQGFSAEADQGSTEQNGGRQTHFSLTGGLGSLDKNGYNVLVSYNLQRQQQLTTLQRGFATRASAQGISSNTFPANYSQGDNIFANPSSPGCVPPIVIPSGDGATCKSASALFFDLAPYSSSDGLFSKASLQLPGDNVASIEYFRTEHRVKTVISPDVHGGDTLPYASPYFPGKGITPVTNPTVAGGTLDQSDLTLYWRLTPIGGRTDDDHATEDRLAATLKGTVFTDLDYSLALFTTHSRVDQAPGGGYADDGIIQDFLSGTNGVYGAAGDNPNGVFINPFGANNATQIAAMASAQAQGTLISAADFTRGASFSLSKPVATLPGGDLNISGGAEVRREQFVYNVNDTLATALVNSTGIPPGSSVPVSSRNSNAVFLEALAPITKSLEAGVAVRMDHYDDFGTTTNPKFSLRFQPIHELLFRASAATGFRAPDLLQINQPNSVALTGGKYNDPVLCPNGANGLPPGSTVNKLVSCGVQQNLLFGGNKNLKPEKSRQFTLGVVFQPTREFKASLDLWDVKIKDQVRQPGEGALYNNYGTFASYYVRCSQANPAFLVSLKTQCPAGGSANDNLAYVLDTYANIGEIDAKGADINLNYATNTPVGKWEINYDLSYMNSWKYELYPGAGFVENTGIYSNDLNQAIFRFQSTTSAAWKKDDWSALLVNHFRSGYTDAVPTHHVPQFFSWDAGVTYTGLKNLTVNLMVKNLLGTDPPYSNQSNTFQLGYDPASGDPLGRIYFLSLKYEMK